MKIFSTLFLMLFSGLMYAQTVNIQPARAAENHTRQDLPNSVGSNDQSKGLVVRMYPNPSSGGITIEGFVVNAKSEYKICDATGRQVMQGNLNEGKTTLDISTLLNGMYLITITCQQESTTLRLVKQ